MLLIQSLQQLDIQNLENLVFYNGLYSPQLFTIVFIRYFLPFQQCILFVLFLGCNSEDRWKLFVVRYVWYILIFWQVVVFVFNACQTRSVLIATSPTKIKAKFPGKYHLGSNMPQFLPKHDFDWHDKCICSAALSEHTWKQSIRTSHCLSINGSHLFRSAWKKNGPYSGGYVSLGVINYEICENIKYILCEKDLEKVLLPSSPIHECQYKVLGNLSILLGPKISFTVQLEIVWILVIWIYCK